MRLRALAAVAAVGLVGMVPATAGATSRLPCSASMSNTSPTTNSTTHVLVRTASKAGVTTVAHYKTTNTQHTATADSSGRADVPYRISHATKGYRVVVQVTVQKGSAKGSCSTSFTPR
ncbi:MAG: hypothetical protein M3O32_03695 [Actinomycetota bacterium]|nr:hypothetical protein [Actinomycetota bacterium]